MPLRVPVVHSPSDIIDWHIAEYVDLQWRPSRNCGFYGWQHWKMRMRITWRVFTGRYDALNWGETSGELNAQQRRYVDCTQPEFFNAKKVYEYPDAALTKQDPL